MLFFGVEGTVICPRPSFLYVAIPSTNQYLSTAVSVVILKISNNEYIQVPTNKSKSPLPRQI